MVKKIKDYYEQLTQKKVLAIFYKYFEKRDQSLTQSDKFFIKSIVYNNKCFNPDESKDSAQIGFFIKHNINSSMINIITERYPYAFFDHWYGCKGYSSWVLSFDDIQCYSITD